MTDKEKAMILSASQIEGFIRSPLNWAMSYIERLKEKETKTSHKGRNMGCLFEDFIRHFSTDDFPAPLFNPDTSSQKDFWSIEREAKAVVFNQGELYSHDWEWQHYFCDELLPGLPKFRGYIDMLRFDEKEKKFHIVDVKRTTKIPAGYFFSGSGFDKKKVKMEERFYGKTEDELKHNIQVGIYAIHCSRLREGISTGTVAHSQGIVVRDKGREIAFETANPTVVVDESQLVVYEQLIREAVEKMIEFKKDYTKNGLYATIQIMKEQAGTDDLKEIIPHKLFSRVNPFWSLFNGKKTFDDFERKSR